MSGRARSTGGAGAGLAALLSLLCPPGCSGSATVGVTLDGGQVDSLSDPQPDLTLPPPADDFSKPIIDEGAPADCQDLFDRATAVTDGGPCLIDPEPGVLMPSNWIAPRFRFVPAGRQNLFEIRIESPSEQGPQLVYTTATSWTMTAALWQALRQNAVNQTIKVTVRAGEWDGATLTHVASGTSTTFRIAPVSVSGAIVFWSSGGTDPVLLRATVGDPHGPTLIGPTTQASGTCTGCHAATPTGQDFAFAETMSLGAGSGSDSTVGIAGEPGWNLSQAARQLMLQRPQTGPSFSPAHFSTSDRMMLSVLELAGRSELVWTDLETPSTDRGIGWNVLLRGGDQRNAVHPFFSHDGTMVAYAAASAVTSGIAVQDGDIMLVPWQGRLGGLAMPLAGASDPTWNEFAPSLSSDDRFVAYARAPAGTTSFGNRASEIYVVPIEGGAPTRLAANDRSVCTTAHANLGNSWPRWAPESATSGDRRYYWLAYSSKRGDGRTSQVYVSAVIVDERKQPASITSTPPLYLWTQDPTSSNHTPFWSR